MPRSFVYRIGGSGTGLTQAEEDNNILCIMDNLVGQYGWTKQAAAGACGCFHEESGMKHRTAGTLTICHTFRAVWGLHSGQITRHTQRNIRIPFPGPLIGTIKHGMTETFNAI